MYSYTWSICEPEKRATVSQAKSIAFSSTCAKLCSLQCTRCGRDAASGKYVGALNVAVARHQANNDSQQQHCLHVYWKGQWRLFGGGTFLAGTSCIHQTGLSGFGLQGCIHVHCSQPSLSTSALAPSLREPKLVYACCVETETHPCSQHNRQP